MIVQDQAQLSHVMQCLNDARDVKELDAEVLQRLVVTARNVAVSRPTNLVKFAEKATTAVQTEQRKYLLLGSCKIISTFMFTQW